MHEGVNSIQRIWVLSLMLLPFLVTEGRGSQTDVDVSKPVDVRLTRKIDATGDGKADLIVLRVKAANFREAFAWTISIYSGGKRVYRVKRNDTSIDRLFNDSGFVDGCNGYVQCKERYYFELLLEGIVKSGEWRGGDRLYDRNYDGSIWKVAGDYLEVKHSFSRMQADETVIALAKKLRQRQATILIIPISPEQTEYPMMFVEQVRTFVPIYQW